MRFVVVTFACDRQRWWPATVQLWQQPRNGWKDGCRTCEPHNHETEWLHILSVGDEQPFFFGGFVYCAFAFKHGEYPFV